MGNQKGSITIFLALIMLGFLLFCLVLVEGTRIYYIRVQALQAMELAEFSVLSEYQQELFENYGLFFLDLDYEQGSESLGILKQRMQEYLEKNTEEAETIDLGMDKLCRATDGDGSAFFRQAVELTKLKSGYRVFEKLVGSGVETENVELGELLKENQSTVEKFMEEAVDEEGLPLFQIDLPDISFPSIEALSLEIFGSETGLSEKCIYLQDRLLKRELSSGTGNREDVSLTEMQLFHQYIFRHFNCYGAENPGVLKEALEYQIEYMIAGEESDKKNLENIMWKLFLLRAAGNYLFYHQDASAMGKAQTEAVALVGVTGNAALIEAVKNLFLILQAIEDGIEDTKKLFEGQKVPLYQGGVFSGIELGYEEYLYLFLNMTGAAEKIYRCMDLAELEVRKASGYETFRLDHCTDCFNVQWNYTFPSLFTELSMLNGGIYENTITRKIYYAN